MVINSVKFLMNRDLSALVGEINKYEKESDLWRILPGTSNSAGNLVLHMVGNLRHFIGNEIGKSGYTRDREAEFASSNFSIAELVELVEICKKEVESGLNALPEADLSKEFALPMGGNRYSTEHILLHLTAHLSYHLGQLNYHRRTILSVPA